MISIRDGLDIAEREAWRKVGANNPGWFTWGKRLTPVGVIGAVLAAVGYGAYRAFHAVAGWFDGAETVPSAVAGAGTPAALWIVAGVLVAVTAVALRLASRAMHFAPVAITSVVLVLAWLGIIGYGIGRLG
jgi:hypothetical protein